MSSIIKTWEGDYEGFWLMFLLSFIPIVNWITIPLLMHGVGKAIVKLVKYIWNMKITLKL
jgi:hypothetical protein